MMPTHSPHASLMPQRCARAQALQPFHVMRMMTQAAALELQGRDVVHMEVGEPDFTTAESIAQAACTAILQGKTHYTQAAGLLPLRQAIARHYQPQAGTATITADQVLITPGGSGALQMALLASVDVGDEVLITDPGYPCNRQLLNLLGAKPIAVPVDASSRFQPTLEQLERHRSERTRAVLLASPGNPAGTLLHEDELRRIGAWAQQHGLQLIVDEIYHGLTYEQPAVSAVQCAPGSMVVNSFSKYYGMTGWRLGWLVVPPALQEVCVRLAQNLFIAAPTPAQHAACMALDAQLQPELEARRDAFRQRRDYLVPALRELGFGIPCTPEGAFYIYADCSARAADSSELCDRLLQEAGVVITPGIDFGEHHADQYLRFAFTKPLARLQEGIARLQRYFAG